MTSSETTASAATDLPVPLTRFIGRDRELEALAILLDETRLLTLTGAGGSGKTRLAREAVRHAADRFERVAWADLTALADPALLGERLATVMRVPQRTTGAPLDAAAAAIGGERVLLVLDNCEHLVEACATAAEALLLACPALVVLATSREALGVAGEIAWLVPPLASGEAERLFVDRAQGALSSFVLTPELTPTVQEICRRLDGIPLAIELAAARVRVLSPAQIASSLDDALRLLAGGSRTALPHHRTLRATLDWSFTLLRAHEQALLRRLSVFAGGFTLEAAEAVCGGLPSRLEEHDAAAADSSHASGPDLDDDVLGGISALVDKSLIGAEVDDDTVRYRLLETVRQYGLERLAEAGETDAARASHAEYFVRFAENAEPHLFAGAATPAWFATVQVEADNLRAAAQWAEEDPARADVALRLGFALHWFWWGIGQFNESRQRLEAALALAGNVDSLTRGRALLALGFTMSAQGAVAGVAPIMAEAARLLIGRDEPRNVAYLLTCLSAGCLFAGDVEGAYRFGEQAFGTVAAVPPHAVHAFVRYYLGRAAEAMGEVDRARELLEEAARIGRQIGHRPAIAHPLSMLGRLALNAGDPDAAHASLAESLEIHVETHDGWGTALALEGLAATALARGQHGLALRLTAAADAVRARIHVALVPAEHEARERRIAEVRAAVGSDFDRLYAEGRAMPIAEIMRAVQGETSWPTQEHRIAVPAPSDAVTAPRGTAPLTARRRLRVAALGRLQVWIDDRPVDAAVWGSARPRELLVYLLMHREGRTKEQVGLDFWPELSTTQVRNNFHVTLHRLRRALGGADSVRLVHERYTVDPEFVEEFDAAVFEHEVTAALRALQRQQAGAAAQLEEALARYRGDFLDGESVGDWHLEHRDRLQRLYVDGLMALGDQWAREAQHTRAVDAFGRVLARDELHEEALRAMMRAHVAVDERTPALHAYRRFADRMRQELGSEPDAATVRLFEQLQQHRSP